MTDNKTVLAKLKKLQMEKKALALQELNLRKQLADPEKSQNLYKVAKTIYSLILNTDIYDNFSQQDLMQEIINSLDEKDSEFFIKHKHDFFYKGIELFESNKNSDIQKKLVKKSYIGIRILKKQQTLHQIMYCLLDAKIQERKDNLINELKAIKKKESLRIDLFQKEGFREIKDFHQREFLLNLFSYPQTSIKELAAQLHIAKSTADRWKKKFKDAGLI